MIISGTALHRKAKELKLEELATKDQPKPHRLSAGPGSKHATLAKRTTTKVK